MAKPSSVRGSKSLFDLFNVLHSEQVVKVPKGKRFHLAYLIACIASKQVVKMPRDKRVYIAYLVIYTHELYYKVLENRKVCLIYSVFCIANS